METNPEHENLAKTFKEFAYVVSHDLGTPLRAIVEFSRLLKTDNPDALNDESKMYLNMIITNGEKAQAMLSGLLEYSRLNTVTMPLMPTDLNHLLRQCQEDLSLEIESQKAKLSVDPLPSVDSDAAQMRLLFKALLENALLFHAPGHAPSVAVSAAERENGWLFTVRDEGIGIDPRFHERIFQPFKRLHPDGEYPGVGMGLALAKKVVDRHGGRIWVDSTFGQGASFNVLLPAKGVQ